MKRALVISRKTIHAGDILQFLSTKINNEEKEIELRSIAKKIWEDAGKPCSKHDVWIDIPKPPSFKESSATFIRTNKTDADKDLKPLSEFFPTQQWTDQYNTHKLKGHLFCPDDCKAKIAKSALNIFKSEFGIIFKTEAYTSCKNLL
ncbi:hypothetical protein KKD19_04255 [Patescibacteria group bacterium]|nr:hypothetical protein [Patescibacteria group bacterium]MBU4512420.1 hypothetical protein [Patescibacteria group bacterium]MCG2693270.1 hypothetical protein [Candidatus Parcubacteria bacterium]